MRPEKDDKPKHYFEFSWGSLRAAAGGWGIIAITPIVVLVIALVVMHH